MDTTVRTRGLPRASTLDTARVALSVVAPMLAQGIIVRRPRVVALAERLDVDRRAARTLERMRTRYGSSPLLLRIPGREYAVVLDCDDVGRILDESPAPFAVANREKVSALSHFQPNGVIVSHGELRARRRFCNEAALDTGRQTHRLADQLLAVVRAEAADLTRHIARTGHLSWDDFAVSWWRLVRHAVLGPQARDDDRLTDQLATLRRHANWAFLSPGRPALRRAFTERLRHHVHRAAPGSLAGHLMSLPNHPDIDPVGQVPQWLFAFDAAGIATYRAAALLASHPEHTRRDPAFLRATMLESVRLWPTTLAILRDATTGTAWRHGDLPAGTGVMIVSSYFHRDERVLGAAADRFTPQMWMDGSARDEPALVPFSAGPAVCAGQNVVLMLTTQLLDDLFDGRRLRLLGDRLHPDRPLPRTLAHTPLRFAVR